MKKSEYDSINLFPIHLEYSTAVVGIGSDSLPRSKPEIVLCLSKGEQVWGGNKREVFNTIDKRELPYQDLERIRIIPKDWDKAKETEDPAIVWDRLSAHRKAEFYNSIPPVTKDTFFAASKMSSEGKGLNEYIKNNLFAWLKENPEIPHTGTTKLPLEFTESGIKPESKEQAKKGCTAECDIAIHSAKAKFKGSLYSDNSVSFTFDGISKENAQEIERIMEVIRGIFRENFAPNPPPPISSQYTYSLIEIKNIWLNWCKEHPEDPDMPFSRKWYNDRQFANYVIELNTKTCLIRIALALNGRYELTIWYKITSAISQPKTPYKIEITKDMYEELKSAYLYTK